MKLVVSGAIALATTIAVLVPTAAHAGNYVRPDTKGDVFSYDLESESETPTKEPDRTEGDIVNSGVTHGSRRVTAAVRLAELSMSGQGTFTIFRMGTKNRNRSFILVGTPGRWQGSLMKEKDNGQSFRCKGVRWSMQYNANLVRISVPKRCLGRGAWVRVGMATATVEDPKVFLDDAGTNGYLGMNPKWGPRVYR